MVFELQLHLNEVKWRLLYSFGFFCFNFFLFVIFFKEVLWSIQVSGINFFLITSILDLFWGQYLCAFYLSLVYFVFFLLHQFYLFILKGCYTQEVFFLKQKQKFFGIWFFLLTILYYWLFWLLFFLLLNLKIETASVCINLFYAQNLISFIQLFFIGWWLFLGSCFSCFYYYYYQGFVFLPRQFFYYFIYFIILFILPGDFVVHSLIFLVFVVLSELLFFFVLLVKGDVSYEVK